jgi:hypothetical protein
LNAMAPSFSSRRARPAGWGGRIRTFNNGNQNPVAYH